MVLSILDTVLPTRLVKLCASLPSEEVYGPKVMCVRHGTDASVEQLHDENAYSAVFFSTF